ncbi:MAG: hypothetical protein ACR2JC_12275 [Chloroflexota bacterium]
MGQLYLDDVETLDRRVPLEELGELSQAQVLKGEGVSVDSVVG